MRFKKNFLICLAVSLFSGIAYAQKPAEQEKLDLFKHQDGIVFKTVNGKKLNMIYFEPQNVKPGEKTP